MATPTFFSSPAAFRKWLADHGAGDAARTLPPHFEAAFRENEEAWRWFSSQAPSYRRVAIHWVVSAKQETTQRRRLSTLIADSAAGRRLARYTRA